MTERSATARREGVTAVHSLDHFVFSVPDLDEAARFYDDFGLDVRRRDDRLHLHTAGHPHRWGTVLRAAGDKRLQYLAFGAFAEDLDAVKDRLARLGIKPADAHPQAETSGVWFRDPEGVLVHVLAAQKVSPATKSVAATAAVVPRGAGAAPARSKAPKVRPRRLSHVLLFTSDVARSRKFYGDALGLRLSDHSGDGIAFLHGAHASDHHMLAFAKSDGPGLHHSSWDVASIDEVGLGMEQMTSKGHTYGWGVGRHVVGSNYFYYARDPWGSFAEYSHDIDFIPADVDWPAKDHPPEDAFYVWGPPPPDYFIQNHETAARRAA
jgi:catechol 2,3-dioxygenase-like lactoylglutathione lyase family enzyme